MSKERRKRPKNTSPPLANGLERSPGDGRDSGGKFTVANRHGRGNGGAPLAARALQLRAALLQSVSRDDIRAIVAALVTKARRGDVRAAREILNRAVGKPSGTDPREMLQILVAGEAIVAERIDAFRSLKLSHARGEALDVLPADDPRLAAAEVVAVNPPAERRRVLKEIDPEDTRE